MTEWGLFCFQSNVQRKKWSIARLCDVLLSASLTVYSTICYLFRTPQKKLISDSRDALRMCFEGNKWSVLTCFNNFLDLNEDNIQENTLWTPAREDSFFVHHSVDDMFSLIHTSATVTHVMYFRTQWLSVWIGHLTSWIKGIIGVNQNLNPHILESPVHILSNSKKSYVIAEKFYRPEQGFCLKWLYASFSKALFEAQDYFTQ